MPKLFSLTLVLLQADICYMEVNYVTIETSMDSQLTPPPPPSVSNIGLCVEKRHWKNKK